VDGGNFHPVLCQYSAGAEMVFLMASRGIDNVEGEPMFSRRLAARLCFIHSSDGLAWIPTIWTSRVLR